MSMGVIKPKAIPDHVALLQAGFIERAVLDYFKDPYHTFKRGTAFKVRA